MHPGDPIDQTRTRQGSREAPSAFDKKPRDATLAKRRQRGGEADGPISVGLDVDHRNTVVEQRLPAGRICRRQC